MRSRVDAARRGDAAEVPRVQTPKADTGQVKPAYRIRNMIDRIRDWCELRCPAWGKVFDAWLIAVIVGVLVVILSASVARGDEFTICQFVAAPSGNYSSPLLSVSVRIIGESPRHRTYATGTVIQSDPCLILTAGHVYESGMTYSAHWTDGKKLPITHIAAERSPDLALFSCAAGGGSQSVAISGDSPNSSEWTWTIGSDHGAELTENRGIILSVNRSGRLESSAVAVEGRSGGGVFVLPGKLVGVISARDPGNSNATVATSCQSIFDFLGRNRGRCPGGVCPQPNQPPQQQPPGGFPATPPPVPPPAPVNPDIEILKKEVKDLKDQIASLKLIDGPIGPRGPPGENGRNGNDGLPGKDANSQVVIDWFKENKDLFKGADGKDFVPKSFVLSFVGADGTERKSIQFVEQTPGNFIAKLPPLEAVAIDLNGKEDRTWFTYGVPVTIRNRRFSSEELKAIAAEIEKAK